MLLETIDQLADKAKLRLVKADEVEEGTPGQVPRGSLITEDKIARAEDQSNPPSDMLTSAPGVQVDVDAEKIAAAKLAAEEMGEAVDGPFGKVAVMRTGPMGLDIVGNAIRKVC